MYIKFPLSESGSYNNFSRPYSPLRVVNYTNKTADNDVRIRHCEASPRRRGSNPVS